MTHTPPDPAGHKRHRPYRFGWYGDAGMGETLIQLILDGRQTASACPASEPEDIRAGETLVLIDKAGRERGRILVTRIETRRFDGFEAGLEGELGLPLERFREMFPPAEGRAPRPDEPMRVTHFELLP